MESVNCIRKMMGRLGDGRAEDRGTSGKQEDTRGHSDVRKLQSKWMRHRIYDIIQAVQHAPW